MRGVGVEGVAHLTEELVAVLTRALQDQSRHFPESCVSQM